jgi:DNA-binding transcriptional ArsR family regulator
MIAHRSEDPSDHQLLAAVATLKILADPTRLRIVWALLHGEHSVGDLAAHVGVRPAAVSQHLAKLRLAGLVRTRREGVRIFYAAHNDHILQLVEHAIFHVDHIADDAMAHEQVDHLESSA